MKHVLCIASITAVVLLVGCGQGGNGGAQATNTVSPTQNEGIIDGGSPQTQAEESTDFNINIGEGVTVDYMVTSDLAALEITGCPSRGDMHTPFVYGKMTHGDTFAYELITIISLNNNYYGKKPFQNAANGFFEGDGSFVVQFSSNDGIGEDWNAGSIYLFMVPSGYVDGIEPDGSMGYVIPPAQVSALRNDSVCVVHIKREAPGV